MKKKENRTPYNIVRGDKVQVIGRRHPERGKQGIVKEVLRKLDRVIVEGVNMGPRRIKGDPDRGIKGTTIMKERTIHYSAVNLVDPVTNQPTRVYRKYLEDGTKVRISKKSGAIIPRPDILTVRRKPVNAIVTKDDTSDEDAWEVTYQP
jgi:large subunit ribosomal protein L24